MKRNIFVGTMLCAVVAVGAAAQSPSPSTPPAEQSSSKREQSMTMTGCLQAADAPTASATGTSGGGAKTGSKADTFILASATPSSTEMAPATTGTTGAVGTTGTATATAPEGQTPPSASPAPATATAEAASAGGRQYTLSGGNKDQLRGYVDSKVEITGKVAAAASESKTGAPTLHVDSIHQVSPSCSK